MQKIFIIIIKNAPLVLFSLALLLIQLLFVNINIVGVYLFGRVCTSQRSYKLIPIIICITLLYDATKVAPFGTWALSFSIVALSLEILCRILRIRNELDNNTLRSQIILFVTVVTATIAQTYLLKSIASESFVFSTQYSIVALAILYIAIHRTTTAQNKNNLVDLI